VVNLNQPSISHGFWDIKLQRYWGHDLDLSGSCDDIGHVTIGLAVCSFLLVVYEPMMYLTRLLRYCAWRILGSQTWRSWGHVTSSITWPLDSQYAVSYRWSIWTDCQCRTVYEILSLKYSLLGSPKRISLQVVIMSVCHFVLKLCRNRYGDDIQFYRCLAITFHGNHQSLSSHYGNDTELRGGSVENLSMGALPISVNMN